jgi:hypothetical protein
MALAAAARGLTFEPAQPGNYVGGTEALDLIL